MKVVLIIFILMTSLIEKSTEDVAFIESMGNLIGMLQDSSDSADVYPVIKTGSEYQDKTQATSGNPEVTTTSGRVIGSTFDKAHGFFSIPYAAPPIGDLRFRETMPFQSTSETINATVPGRVACRQLPQDECYAGYCVINQKEDCLVLNVFVPRSVDLSNPSGHKLPVLLWIHGGAFFSGSGTTTKYDGRHLSKATNCIVVSINYRLGAYGFLVYNKGDDLLNGNQGLKDQRTAMKWVQDNIASFGGDKDRVTIFGESAGAQSVMFHMLSPLSRPFYKRAILQSNAAIFPHQTPDEAMNVTNRLLKVLNCSDENELDCLLNAPAETLDLFPKIMAASVAQGDAWSAVEPYRPVIDGEEFTDQPLTLFQSGKWNTDKDYIIGANTQEVEIIQYYIPGDQGMSKLLFRQVNKLFLGEEAGTKTADFYEDLIGPDENGDYSKVFGKEAGDAFFICPSRAMSRFTYQTGENKNGNYFYIFGVAPDGEYCHAVYPKNETCGYSYHSAEIPYVFRTGPDFGYIFNEDEITVTDHLSKYWGNFARSGNPNDDTDGPNYPDRSSWPSHTKTVEGIDGPWQTIYIYPTCYTDVLFKEEICDFWDSLNFYVHMPPTTPTTYPTTKPVELTTSGADQTFAVHVSTLLFSFGLLVNILHWP